MTRLRRLEKIQDAAADALRFGRIKRPGIADAESQTQIAQPVSRFEVSFQCIKEQPEKTADITRRHHWFPREMTSEKRVQKFHTDDVSLGISG